MYLWADGYSKEKLDDRFDSVYPGQLSNLTGKSEREPEEAAKTQLPVKPH